MAIDEVDAAALSYATFCELYMARNRPVLIRNVVDKWFPNAADWVARGRGENASDATINFDLLRRKYGHHDVPVVDGAAEEYGAREYITMKFATYLNEMEAGSAGMRYLKDWHFVKETREDPPLYTTPEYFEDDWLNWWWDRNDQRGDDYRFVYIGPTGSSTPMHHDVFRSYSWSVNIVGRKEWIFFHPDDEGKLKDKFGRTLLADVTSVDYDRDLYPHAHEATPLHVTQLSGDAIFVPSGWFHQVKNTEHTISINHNWFNGYSIDAIWRFLQTEYSAVEAELDHLKEIGLQGDEFRAQCQLVMRANTGMNYEEFKELLEAKRLDLEMALHRASDAELELDSDGGSWRLNATRDHLAKPSSRSPGLGQATPTTMPADRIKELESEVEALKQANDGLYRQHANEKAQMQLAIEHEKVKVIELTESNAAFREENDQWRLSYDALDAAKRESEDTFESQRREMSEKITSLEDTVTSYTSELVDDLQELEREKSDLAARDQTIVEMQQQLDDGSHRFAQLLTEYDAIRSAHEQLSNEKKAREHEFVAVEAQLREHISQLGNQVAGFESQVQAMSQNDEAKGVNQHALLARAQQEVADKDAHIAQLTQKVTQLEDEVSLLALTGGSGGVTTTLRDLQQQLFQKSEELVDQGEKHLQLAANCDKYKQQLQAIQQEVETVRSSLLKGIVGNSVDETAYQHVKLSELVRLRLKSVEHELRLLNATSTSNGAVANTDALDDAADAEGGENEDDAASERPPTTHLANVESSFSAVESFGTVGRLERELRLAKSRNKRLQSHIDQLQLEVAAAMNNLSEFQALKEKAVELVSRERVEKELRFKAETNCTEATEKIVALSEHIEKLMVHLKHEAAAKTKAVDLHRRTDKELLECKDKLAVLTKKNTMKDQQIQELEQGAKILEDQLRLMDEKFIDVRNKLDWTRATTQKETKRLQNELSALRMKWQLASDMGALSALPDWANTPKLKPTKTKPLGSSSSDSRLMANGAGAGGGGNNGAGANGLSPLRTATHTADPFTMRFEIPKLPQPDSEAGTPWSDAKLSVLQRQLQDKRKG